MYPKKTKPNYNMSYAELSGISKQRANTIMRDIEEFEKYSISMDEIVAFKQKVIDFDKIPTDDGILLFVVLATEEKNRISKEVLISIRNITNFIKQRYPYNWEAFARLKLGSLGKISDLKLHRAVSNFCLIVRNLDFPEKDTFINKMTDDLEALNIEFNNIIDLKNKRVEERNIATMERVATANQIYSKLVEYSKIGQMIWAKTNEAKYNDYIIYKNKKRSNSIKNENTVLLNKTNK